MTIDQIIVRDIHEALADADPRDLVGALGVWVSSGNSPVPDSLDELMPFGYGLVGVGDAKLRESPEPGFSTRVPERAMARSSPIVIKIKWRMVSEALHLRMPYGHYLRVIVQAGFQVRPDVVGAQPNEPVRWVLPKVGAQHDVIGRLFRADSVETEVTVRNDEVLEYAIRVFMAPEHTRMPDLTYPAPQPEGSPA